MESSPLEGFAGTVNSSKPAETGEQTSASSEAGNTGDQQKAGVTNEATADSPPSRGHSHREKKTRRIAESGFASISE